MILLTRLSGSVFALNSELIERVDSTPDTVITLVGGTKYVVAENLLEIILTVREERASVLALSESYVADAAQQRGGREPHRPSLSVVSANAATGGPDTPPGATS